jgi:hypothetical protein
VVDSILIVVVAAVNEISLAGGSVRRPAFLRGLNGLDPPRLLTEYLFGA